ncbi:MAG TPA: PLP-dependent aminotransferase family protein [Clostridia bacterium]|nr:PLP-dependent aminotransferase family protein [Clostridia bacterium]
MFELARRMDKVKTSDIRELLKLTDKPGMISFGGGLPAPELFPVERLKEVTAKVLESSGAEALQYAATEGYQPLRRKIAERMNRRFGTLMSENNILVTCGSQQGLDFTGKIFINEGDTVLCESPTYLGAINAFSAYGPKMVEVPTDNDGMLPEQLEHILDTERNIRLIYVIPDSQNPSGRTWSTERRKRFMELLKGRNIPVLEDAPYSELRFDGNIMPSLKSMDTEGIIIYLGTFSKVFCPGMRIGWVAADERILEKYGLVKQGADLHSSNITQRNISAYMEMYDLDSDIERIRLVYKSRRDAMHKALLADFPGGARFTHPEGGLFTWVELEGDINTRELLVESLGSNVAFVPGESFFPNGGGKNTMRLNFSNMPEEKITEGIKILGDLIKRRVNCAEACVNRT